METDFRTTGFHLSRSKTESMLFKFSKRQGENDLEVKMEENVIPQVSKFKSLPMINFQTVKKIIQTVIYDDRLVNYDS